MRVLLDTHTLLWCFNASSSLSPKARRLIEDGSNEIIVSAASAWEIATKVRLGKLPTGEELVSDFDQYLSRLGFESLPISVEHAVRAGRLPGEHRDPFDRMLISQSQAEDLPIVSNDRIFDDYHVRRIW
ncbi:MAG TPA: type II toxin-antitoxin system VapC family toxin [Candidatus Sulfotelmatobacter sp.]|jgi:PIN domain nuclease of toxin-antitoxin system|nr:type II toxin-antitoxin system VapC family toxin [Candidatus Sulfotelmatobacter sp.]